MKKIILLLLLFGCKAYAQKPQSAFRNDSITSYKPLEEIIDSIFVGYDHGNSASQLLYSKKFPNNMHFESVSFTMPAKFYLSVFQKDVSFEKAAFASFVDFSGATFKKDVIFSSCTFQKTLFLSGIEADSIAIFNFYNATLPDLIDFSHNKRLSRVVDFTDANLALPAREKVYLRDTRVFINIFDTDISKLKLDYLHFRICFYDPNQTDKSLTYSLNEIKKEYKDKHGSHDTTGMFAFVYPKFIELSTYKDYIKTVFPSVNLNGEMVREFTMFYYAQERFPAMLSEDQTEALYSKLLKNFDNNGQKRSYESCDIDRNEFISGFWNFSRYWNQFGYHKEWIFGWTLFFLLILSWFSYLAFDNLFIFEKAEMPVYKLDNIPSPGAICRNHKWKKFRCAFIYTSVIFFSFSLKTEHINFKKNIFYFVVIINVVGLLCLGYLANFVLQK